MFYSFICIGIIPKYFILFVAMVNGIVSLISLSVFSLLVYRNARDFCVLPDFSYWKYQSVLSANSESLFSALVPSVEKRRKMEF